MRIFHRNNVEEGVLSPLLMTNVSKCSDIHKYPTGRIAPHVSRNIAIGNNVNDERVHLLQVPPLRPQTRLQLLLPGLMT
jgi:hypothetical protein